MSRALVAWLLAAGFAASSCALLAPGRESAPATGEVELQIFSGFARPPSGTALPARRVVVLVDATRSMLRPDGHGETLFDAARRSAGELLRARSADDEVELHAIGPQRRGACGLPERISGRAGATDPAALAAALGELRPGAEGSIATALREIQTELDAAGATRRSRVVVFSDLEPSCGGDLCEAAGAMVQAGGWVELRTVGDVPVPACIAALRPSADVPGWSANYLAPPASTFRVVQGEGDVRTVLASGTSGAGPVTAPAGLVALDVDLLPPERIGPFRLRPGERVRVRLLDFSGAVPPDRAWQVEREGESFERRKPGTDDPGVEGSAK